MDRKKKVKKTDLYLAMSCYRYAPEQFWACRITGFSGGNKNIPIYERIRLSYEEARQCGYAYCCKGRDAALAELKRILRARVRNQRQYYTIGFLAKDGRNYAYIRELRFDRNNLESALQTFKAIKKSFANDNWRVKRYTSAKLDGNYKPIPESVTESYMELDPKRPVFIRFVFEEAI